MYLITPEKAAEVGIFFHTDSMKHLDLRSLGFFSGCYCKLQHIQQKKKGE